MRFTAFSLALLSLFCFVFFSYGSPQEELDLAQVRKAIEEMNVKFGDAVRKGDAASLASFYTEDAVILPPDSGMLRGRENVEAFWNGVFQMGVKDAELTVVEVMGSGDFVYEIGKYNMTITSEAQEPVQQKGKYLVVWKKAADGSWKLHVDIWNAGIADE